MRPFRPFRQARVRFALAGLAAIAACRAAGDAVTPPRPEFPLEQGGFRRLTYNPHSDVGPAWTPDGAGVSYVAESLPGAAQRWLRAQVPAQGGSAQEELASYPLGQGLETLTLSRSATGHSAALAFLEYYVPCPCMLDEQPDVWGMDVVEVPLDEAAAPLSSLRQMRLPLVGVYQHTDTVPIAGPFPLYRIRTLPAYRRRRDDRSNPYGPSWAPDGTRLVLSDGDSLHLWTLATGSREAVPGVGDAAFPRWSPDGQWIAFAHYSRDSSAVRKCEFAFNAFARCYNDLHLFYTRTPEVWMVHPDGTGLQRVTPGEESAWSPGSVALLVRRPEGLVLHSIGSGDEQLVSNTAGAMEPAFGPDGSSVAFVSRVSGNLDVWTFRWILASAAVSRSR